MQNTNGSISELRYAVKLKTCLSVYYSSVYSHLVYSSVFWQYTSKENINKLSLLQKQCIRLITFSQPNDHCDPLFKSLKILKLEDILKVQVLKFMFDFCNNLLPTSLHFLFNYSCPNRRYNTRNTDVFKLPNYNLINFGKNSVKYTGPNIWNYFSKSVPSFQFVTTLSQFKNILKSHFLSFY